MRHRVRRLFLRCCTVVCTIVVFLGLMGFNRIKQSSSSNTHLVEFKNKDKFATVPSFLIGSLSWKPSEHKTTLITNRACTHYYYLLILVSSAPSHLDRRNGIRKTWARDNTLKWPRWKTVFLVGQTRIQNVSEALLKEDKDFGDLVRGDYYENYYNQTYKIQMGFEWAVRYCEYSFLLKVDDDVFVDTIRVTSYLSETSTPRKELYIGNLVSGVTPVRNEGKKWSVSLEEYSDTYYPDYCSGFGFVLSHDVVVVFVEVFDFVPFYKIDDVYVGILAKETGIQALHSPGFENGVKVTDNLCIPFTDTLVRHGTLGECLLEIYNRSTVNHRHLYHLHFIPQ